MNRPGFDAALFKNEAVAKDSPFRSGPLKTETDVMEIVFEWVHWYNNERLHSTLDHQTPEEYEQTYYDLQPARYPTTPSTNRRHDSRDGSVSVRFHSLESGTRRTLGCRAGGQV